MITLDINCELWRFCRRPDPPCWCGQCRALAAPFWVDHEGQAWVAASDGHVLVMQREDEQARDRRRVHTLPPRFEAAAWGLLAREPSRQVVTGERDALCRWLEDLVSPVFKRDRIGCPTERRCQVDREAVCVRMLGVVVDAGRLCEVLDNAPNGRVRFRAATWRDWPCLDVCSLDWAARVMSRKHDDPDSLPSWPEAVPHGQA